VIYGLQIQAQAYFKPRSNDDNDNIIKFVTKNISTEFMVDINTINTNNNIVVLQRKRYTPSSLVKESNDKGPIMNSKGNRM